MSTTKTIIRYAVVAEIDLPETASEKFNNSDKPWFETNLGYNNKVSVIAFEAVAEAARTLTAVSHTA
jgi:hypothetical protein